MSVRGELGWLRLAGGCAGGWVSHTFCKAHAPTALTSRLSACPHPATLCSPQRRGVGVQAQRHRRLGAPHLGGQRRAAPVCVPHGGDAAGPQLHKRVQAGAGLRRQHVPWHVQGARVCWGCKHSRMGHCSKMVRRELHIKCVCSPLTRPPAPNLAGRCMPAPGHLQMSPCTRLC